MVNYTEEFSMECEPTMDSMWNDDSAHHNMIDDAFPADPNTSFDDDASFSSSGHDDIIVSPSPQSYHECDEIENTLDDLMDMPLYDLYDSPPHDATPAYYESDDSVPMTGFDTVGIVTPPSSVKSKYQGDLPPAPPVMVVTPDVHSSNSSSHQSQTMRKRLQVPGPAELDEQYTQAIVRFAASMRRSEATRSEILRQRLLVHNMDGFNAGANSRSQLWSALHSSQA